MNANKNMDTRMKKLNKLSLALAVACVAAMPVVADDKNPSSGAKQSPTDMDLAGDVGRYFGQRASLYRDNNRKLAKLDLDADFNFDGEINNDDPADNGAFQTTPPGLIVGVGELTKVTLRLTPYKIDYQGRAKVKIQVDGINRDDKSGKFAEGQEASGMGHIVVWLDSSRKQKILDSRNPNLRSFEWTLDNRTPANIQVVPRSFYVEGVSASPRHLGDVRLLVSVYDDNPNYDMNPKMDPRRWIKTFRPSFDHILLSVMGKPQPKQYVNANSDGVWVTRK